MNLRMPSGKCQKCQKWTDKLTLDHILPEWEAELEGVEHNTLDNMQWLCLPCERVKTKDDLRRCWTDPRRQKQNQERIAKITATKRRQHGCAAS